MIKRRRISLWLIALLVVAGLAVKWQQAAVGHWLFERAVSERAGRDITRDWGDGLTVALCGTGSPLPSEGRAGACTLVAAGNRLFLFDAGEGSARTLSMMGVPAGKVERLLLTHFHSDHLDGLGPLMLMRWTGASATTPLPVHGPEGVEAVISGFNAAYAIDNGYRTAHHGAKIAPPSGAGAQAQAFALPAPGASDSVLVLDDGGVKITAFRVSHEPVAPSVGYRIDYKGRSVVISGDTAESPSLVAAAKRADLLVHEALNPRMVGAMTKALEARGIANTATITRDILTYHATPEQAADAAKAAGVKALVLTHIVPPTPSRFFDPAFLGDAPRRYNGPIRVGSDGMIIVLPAGTTAIKGL